MNVFSSPLRTAVVSSSLARRCGLAGRLAIAPMAAALVTLSPAHAADTEWFRISYTGNATPANPDPSIDYTFDMVLNFNVNPATNEIVSMFQSGRTGYAQGTSAGITDSFGPADNIILPNAPFITNLGTAFNIDMYQGGTASFAIIYDPDALSYFEYNSLDDAGGFQAYPVTVIFAGYLSGDPEAVPEPASWAMLIAGFGVVGAALRTQRRWGFVTAN